MLFLTGKNCGHNCRWYCHNYTRMILWLYRSDQQYYVSDIYMIYFYYAVGITEETLADPECEGVWYSRMEQRMKTISTFGEKYMYLDDYMFVFGVNKKIEWSIMVIIYFQMSLCSDFSWPNTLRMNSEYLYNSVSKINATRFNVLSLNHNACIRKLATNHIWDSHNNM